MNIGIIGSGPRAEALGRLLSAKHQVTFSSPRTADGARRLAEATGNGAAASHPYEQAMHSDVLILTEWADADAYFASGGPLKELLVVDATDRTSAPNAALTATEQLARKLDSHRVAKAFNAVEPGRLASDARLNAAMPYCGNADRDKRLVAALIADAGFRPVDAGHLADGRGLEPGGRYRTAPRAA